MTDQELVQLLFSRDEDALSALSNQYGSYCKAVVRNIPEGHDATGELLEQCIGMTYRRTDITLRLWGRTMLAPTG